ncbi:MAG: glycosyltransferase family 4 protein [Clostridia bacterium]
MKKNVWIMNHYATEMFDNKGGRHYNFVKYLTKKGYSPTIFCSNVYHKDAKSIDLDNKKYKITEDENTKMVYIKTTEYTENGLDRVKNMVIFAKNLVSQSKFIGKQQKPDIILASSVHPLTCVAGVFIAKRYKVPCIVEIRDLWPESIVEYSSKFTKKHPLIKILYQGEKWMYKKADKIIFTMQGGEDYIKGQGWDKYIDLSKVYHINNGLDIETFEFNKSNFQIRDDDLENDDIFKIVYTGSIRKANDLGILLDTAKEITNPKIKFLIWGGGDELEQLKQRVIDENIINVHFKGLVEKKYVPYILSRANLNILHYKYTNIFKFGTSQNKNFEYLASGKPILNTIKINYDIVLKNEAGYSLEIQTTDTIKEAILKIYSNENSQEKMSGNAIKTAKEYDFKVLTDKLIEIIESA